MAPDTAADTTEPQQLDLGYGGSLIRLLGTAQVSSASVAAVTREIASGDYTVIALELCDSRQRALLDPEGLHGLDLVQVIRQGEAPMVAAILVLGAMQQRLAARAGIEPGAEMRAAMTGAAATGCRLELIDRDVGITLRRLYRKASWAQRLSLGQGLIDGMFETDSEITEEDLARLREGDLLETSFARFAADSAGISAALFGERDRYMAAGLALLADGQNARILAVVGAGHLQGIAAALRAGVPEPANELARLSQRAVPSPWLKLFSWGVIAVVLVGFAVGFQHGAALGLALIAEWFVITGFLAATGTLLAGGHPLTILSALMGAGVTTLHPAFGTGFLTAIVESFVRRPTVGDFARLRMDTRSWRGWRHNRVARTLLIFVLSSSFAGIGTVIAGFRIGSRIFG